MDIFKKLKKRKTAFISLIILGILVFLALVGNTILGIDPFETNSKIRLLAPGMGHILGTDNLGRDVLARVIYGIRISLAISLVSVAFALIVGTAIGTISGYVGGKVDSVLVLIIEAGLCISDSPSGTSSCNSAGLRHDEYYAGYWYFKCTVFRKTGEEVWRFLFAAESI